MSTTATNPGKPAPPEHSQARGRLIFCLLAVFFALPVIIVTLMYKFEWHPQGSSQGELVAPPIAIELPAGLLDAQGKAIAPDLLRDKWSMVYVTERCAEACMQRLYTMRQLHASMAKDSQRLQRILITQEADWQGLQAEYPDMRVIQQPTIAVTTLARQFQIEPSADTRIYLVDPLANLMMSFPASVEAKAIRKDLVRLLKAAWAG
jgi:hypothetical protein